MSALFELPAEAPVQPRTARGAALLEGLNPRQVEAVVHAGTPLLIVAGAGSGKTRVLTHRIGWLLAERHVHPGEIMSITFTNKAAAEMKERVDALVGRRSAAMWVSTFHSMCVRILRREAKHLGMRSQFSVYDADDTRRLVGLVARDLELDPKKFAARGLAAQISNLKNELLGPDDAAERATNELRAEGRRGLRALPGAAALGERLRLRRPDHGDGRAAAAAAGRRGVLPPPVPARARRRVPGHEPRAVRAGPRAGRARRTRAPSPASCAWSATRTSRSTPSAARASATSPSSSATSRTRAPCCWSRTTAPPSGSSRPRTPSSPATPDRRDKRLWTAAGDGPKLIGYVADNEHDEAAFVAGEIDRLVDNSEIRNCDVAVFYRTNAQSRVFEDVFLRVGLPYRVVGGVRFYERREIRDALAYLRVLSNPDDTVSLRRILNVPKRGIGDRAEEIVAQYADRERISFAAALRVAAEQPERMGALATRSQRCIAGFVRMLDGLAELVEQGEGTAELLEAIYARTGYTAELEASDDPQDASRLENLAELVTVAREFAGDAAVADLAVEEAVENAGLATPGSRLPTTPPGSPSPARSRRSWSAWRWSPTPTRSRTTTRAWSR